MDVRLLGRALALGCTLLLTALLPPFTSQAAIQADIDVDTAEVTLPAPLVAAVSEMLADSSSAILPGTIFRVTSAEVEDGWAVLGLVSLDGQAIDPHAPGVGGLSKLVVAQQQPDGSWRAEIDGVPAFADLAANTPADLLPADAKAVLGVSDAASDVTRPSIKAPVAQSISLASMSDEEVVVDNRDAGFTFVGQLKEAACGVNDHTNWTYASNETDGITNDVAAVWRPTLPQSSQYQVLAHVPSCSTPTTLTTNARYEIAHSGGKSNVAINQSTQRGWVNLGTFSFSDGNAGYVRLTDLTSESYYDKRAIMIDAIKWVPVSESPTPSPSSSPSPSPTPSPTPSPVPTSKVNYKFPWPAGQSWSWYQGWHNNAHDLGSTSTDRRVLAAADGVITSVYSCQLSTIVDIKHADGEVLRYIHIDKNTINFDRIKVGRNVPQGLVLGELKPDTWQDGRCGYTNQSKTVSHIHWVVPVDRRLIIDGWSILYPTNQWVKEDVTKTPSYATKLTSTNQPIASFHLRTFVPLSISNVQQDEIQYP